MAKITYENLKKVLEMNNEQMKEFVYDIITNFSPTSMNVARIMSHLTNTSIHVTSEDKQIWDSAYERAVQYADNVFANMTSLELKIVDELPKDGIVKSTIYLLTTDAEDVYEQFIYSDNKWMSLGKTSINMNQFYTKDDIDSLIKELRQTSQHTHKNLELLDLMTAAFTVEDKTLVDKLRAYGFENIVGHIQEEEIHIGEDDRLALNTAKQLNAKELLDHLVNNAIHISPSKALFWDNMINEAKSYTDEEITNLSIVSSVEALPDDPRPNVIYVVPNETPSEGNLYLKYIHVNGNWERLGGGSDMIPDMSLYCTVLAMQQYVDQRSHSHDNKDILDSTDVAFTTAIMADINSLLETQLLADVHMTNTSLHVTTEQAEILNNLESRVSELVSRTVDELMDSILKVKIVDILPTFLADVEPGVIYFVRRSGGASTGNGSSISLSGEDVAEINISSVEKAVNYDKYIWSSENECWECFSPGSMVLTDAEINEILLF